MHDFGWQCSPVDRAGTQAPPYKNAIAAGTDTQKATPVMPDASVSAPSKPQSAAKPKATAKTARKVPPRKAKSATTGKPARPAKLSAARGGKADKLQQISGIGPKLEKTLHGLGFFHFDQIAEWNKDEVKWVDEHLRFKGRIDREEWIPQAKLLAQGDLDGFAKKFGGPKGKSGKSRRSKK